MGIIINLFTGTAIFNYAVLGIRMTAIFNYVVRGIRRDPSGEANHPWDNNKLRPGGLQPPEAGLLLRKGVGAEALSQTHPPTFKNPSTPPPSFKTRPKFSGAL